MRTYPGRWPNLQLGVLFLAVAALAPAPLDARGLVQDRDWLQCSGEARLPEPDRPSAYRPVPVAGHFFDLALLEAGVRPHGGGPSGGGAFFLVRWISGRLPEASGDLEGAPWRMVLFEVLVTADGPPATFNLSRSSGNARVDQHVEWLIPSLAFTAMRVEGTPFGSWLSLPLRLESPQE